MKKIAPFFLITITIIFLQGSSGCQREAASPKPSSSEYVYGEIILKFKPEAFDEKGELVSESIRTLNTRYGLISMEPLFKRMPSRGFASYIYKLKFPADINVMELIEEYKKDASVIYAEPNYIMHAVKKESNAD